jgi:hypothetical protein
MINPFQLRRGRKPRFYYMIRITKNQGQWEGLGYQVKIGISVIGDLPDELDAKLHPLLTRAMVN